MFFPWTCGKRPPPTPAWALKREWAGVWILNDGGGREPAWGHSREVPVYKARILTSSWTWGRKTSG